MRVRDVGEFHLIDLLADALHADGLSSPHSTAWTLRQGVGDDAAVWEASSGTRVLSTDTMVDGVHFELGRIAWRDLGWKIMAVNLSDIAAMGCAPACSVVTLGLPGDLPVAGLVEMYRGMADVSSVYGGAVVGGDIVGSPVFFVTVAMEGTPVVASDGEDVVLLRSAAQAGDIVAVTGMLGDSAGGLRILLDGQPFDSQSVQMADAHFRPSPRIVVGQEIARAGVRAAIDVSDGLLGDLAKLCDASGVGAVVRAQDVPVSPVLRSRFPNEWLSLALTGGEDYELLFAAPERAAMDVRDAVSVPVTIVGEIVDSSRGIVVMDECGRTIQTTAGGWDHFPTALRSGRGR